LLFFHIPVREKVRVNVAISLQSTYGKTGNAKPSILWFEVMYAGA
jgi:hypothetical protein